MAWFSHDDDEEFLEHERKILYEQDLKNMSHYDKDTKLATKLFIATMFIFVYTLVSFHIPEGFRLPLAFLLVVVWIRFLDIVEVYRFRRDMSRNL